MHSGKMCVSQMKFLGGYVRGCMKTGAGMSELCSTTETGAWCVEMHFHSTAAELYVLQMHNLEREYGIVAAFL